MSFYALTVHVHVIDIKTSAKLTQNTPVENNIFWEQNFQLIEFLSCFLTSISTLRDGSL